MFNSVTAGYDGSDATWEIIIMLLVAFLLGFILRHLFCCKGKATTITEEIEPKASVAPQKQVRENNVTRVTQALAMAGIPEPVKGTPQPQVKNNKVTRVTTALAKAGIAEPVKGAPKPEAAIAPVEDIPTEPESLRKVEGIGPKIEGLLHAGGVLTMRQLATVDLNIVQDILTAAGPRYTMHNPKTWSAQAELIADEKWDELKKYQDFLVGGREPGN